jgi:hypothetical protein
MSRRAALLFAALSAFCAVDLCAQAAPVAPPDADTRVEEVADTARDDFFFNKGRDYGTDVYAGPFDIILNKGFAVAQWQGRDRAIFSFPYGWDAVWASVTRPGKAMEQAGGWGSVLKRHLVPFAGDNLREAQWVPNYFGHLLEGGMAYRRLLEWNRLHDIPFATLNAMLVTQFAVILNEAYETPVDDPSVQENGTAGLFVDVVIMDPLGILLFHQNGVSRFFAEKLGTTIWPRQASITFPGARVINNGEAVVIRPKLWFTDDFRFFVRTGIGAQFGISVPRDDGLEVGIGIGAESHERQLDAAGVESAEFSLSAGLWIDREGSLLFSATWDEKTDRSLAIDVFPGVIQIAGTTIGAWFQFDRDYRPYIGITGRRTLGMGIGAAF